MCDYTDFPMKSGKCPKCSGEDIIIPVRRERVVRHQRQFQSDEYLCQNCGYTEAYRIMDKWIPVRP